MKLLMTVLAVLSVLSFCSLPATAQDDDCWHYENGDASIVGDVVTPNRASGVAVSGSYAYIVSGANYPGGQGALHVIDITTTASPQIVGSIDTTADDFSEVAVSGSYAYVTGSFFGTLHVIDIATAADPQIVSYLNLPGGQSWDVAMSGNYAYVATSYGLQVVDISVPESPAIVGAAETPDRALGVAVAGNYAYVADDESGLQVIDITNPASPQIVGSVDMPDDAKGVAVAGSYAYVGTSSGHPENLGSLQVIDVTDPQSLQITGSVDTPFSVYGVAVSGSYAYVSGLHVIDVSNPSLPINIGGVDSWAGSMALAGDFVYMACGSVGLQIAWQQCMVVAIEDDPEETTPDEELPSAGLRLAVHPNPFNPQTTITFSLERNEWATVSVYELTGRRVALLADRIFVIGTHSLTWSGRDEAGRAMPSGTYLVRLETESAVRAQKLMLIR